MSISASKYKNTSPYFETGYLDGKFLDLLTVRKFPAMPDDIYKQIGATYQYRPDLLSYDLYKTVDYWWVFMMRNRDVIVDPVWDFTADKYIYIPKLATIVQKMS